MSLSLTTDILRAFSYNNVFVETGTYDGGCINVALSCGFQDIRSVEIYEPFYRECKNKFKNFSQVKLYLGDSIELLWKMIEDINEPITFFLDSHIIAQLRNDKLGKKEVPILEELEIIAKHPIKQHTILIDDRQMLEAKEITGGWISEEWKSLLEKDIISKLQSMGNYAVGYGDTKNGKDAMIVAYPKSESTYDPNI